MYRSNYLEKIKKLPMPVQHSHLKIPKLDIIRCGSLLHEEFNWSARYSNCLFECPGPPNQLFLPKNRHNEYFQLLRCSSYCTGQSCNYY